MNVFTRTDVLVIRPYQALCLICEQGGGADLPNPDRLREIREAIMADPNRPVALCCNAGGLFAYQDPGPVDDTDDGPALNLKRDMEILLRMDLMPGAVMPARVLLARLHATVASTAGICGSGPDSSPAWQGCPRALRGVYAEGHAAGIHTLVPPRSESSMEADKRQSMSDMLAAGAIRIRPHILACAVAQYGNGIRPPFPEDNLPEMLVHVMEHPETPITLAAGADWMMCAPCPARVAACKDCAGGIQATQGLYNTLKDLNVMRAAGWTYGLTLSAREMFRQLLERVPDIDGVCAFERDIPVLSVWRDGCGRVEHPCPGYRKGRHDLLVHPAFRTE